MVYETKPPSLLAGLGSKLPHISSSPLLLQSAGRAGSRTSSFFEDASGSEQIALIQGGWEGPVWDF